MSNKDESRRWPDATVVCPACLARGILQNFHFHETRKYYQCRHCRRVYPIGPFGVIDFQVVDQLLRLPEPYLGLWALAQLNSLEDYRNQKEGSVARPDQEVVKSFSRFMDLDGRVVLDIGAGLDYIPGYVVGKSMEHYIALDPLPVEKAVSFHRVQAWAECMPFADGSFDAVILGTSLDHVLCPESALSEIQRVLRSDGEVYMWGAWFPDERFFKNVPEKRLFSRTENDILDKNASFTNQDICRREFLSATSDHDSLRGSFAQYMVDKWHFRHFPLKFVKTLQAFGLQLAAFDLWEWNYHENHIFLNGFAKLCKKGRNAAEETILRDLDQTSLMANVADQILTLSMSLPAAQNSSNEAIMSKIRSEIGVVAARLRDLEVAQSAFETKISRQMDTLNESRWADVSKVFPQFDELKTFYLTTRKLLKSLHASEDLIRTDNLTIIRYLTKLTELQENEFKSIQYRLDRFESQIVHSMETSERKSDSEGRPARAFRSARAFIISINPFRLLKNYSKQSAKNRFKQSLFRFWTGTGHGKLLALTCIYATPLWRRFRRPRKVSANKTVVCHVTCSFDLGGTQRQIRNLCTGNDDPRIEHATTEVFPEQNFIYREKAALDAKNYVKGNFVFRKFGRWVMDINYRSLQLVQIYKLWRDFQRMKPEIVVGWGHEIAMLTFAAGTLARVPKIAFCIRTWNPSFGWTSIPRLLYKSHKKMLPLLDGVIVNSTLLQNDYAHWQRIRPGRIAVCPNGIEAGSLSIEIAREARLRTRRALEIPDDALIIMNIGRFSAEKGQMILLKAFAKVLLAEQGERLYCVLCGDGSLFDAAKAYAAEQRIDHCVFPGRIQDVYPYLCAADIYIMPSDFEGMPNAMMEAMACGLPCISTNRSGALDIGRDNIETLYIDVGAVDQLKDKLLYLIRNPEERRRLGNNARLRLEEFSIGKMVVNFNRILTKISNRKA
jgi:glycosyltransferase involved in cell wall biosynthesis/SAM-dependent methyltransferase